MAANLTFIRHRKAVEIARARMLANTKLFADEASANTLPIASTIRKATATASTPTGLKAVSRTFAAWSADSTTTSVTATLPVRKSRRLA
jgi:hypothetical protein